MNRFIDKIIFVKDKVKGHNLYWDVIYLSPLSSNYAVYKINLKNNWSKIILEADRCILTINETSFYVETFKFAEDIICSYVIANEFVISEENQDKNTIRKLKIKEILGL